MEIKKLTTHREFRQTEEINAMSFFQPLTGSGTFQPEKGRTIWGALENGKVISVIHVIEYEMMYHGAYLPMYGIGGVSTRVEYRNRGYIRMLFQAIFREMEERGYAFSYLYPFSFRYYEKFGYAQAMTASEYTFPAECFKSFPCELDVTLYRPEDDCSPYGQVFETFARRYNGMVRRPDWKRLEQYRAHSNQKYLYLFSHKGEPQAYLGYEAVPGKDGERTMQVLDSAWADPEALSPILGFIGGLHVHLGTCSLTLPDDVPLQRMAVECYPLERNVRPRGQVRITSVETALKHYAWPTESGKLSLAVIDGDFPRNSGGFTVEYGGGRAQVGRTGGPCDLELDIRVLSTLALGSTSFADLPYLDPSLCKVNGNREALAKIFRPRPVFISEYF